MNQYESMNGFGMEEKSLDGIKITTVIALLVSIIAKLVQAVMLFGLEASSVSSDDLFNVGIGLVPSIMMLGYVLVFYKTTLPQVLLPATFLVQLLITVLNIYNQMASLGHFVVAVLWANLIWLAYYTFLLITTYRGCGSPMIMRIIIGALSAYSLVISTINLITIWEEFPEENVIMTSQAIAILGYAGYYVATLFIAPKCAELIYEENNYI